jgi:hypothetical protein
LFVCNADVAQDEACKLGKVAFDQVQPGAAHEIEVNSKRSVGLLGEPAFCLLGDVCGDTPFLPCNPEQHSGPWKVSPDCLRPEWRARQVHDPMPIRCEAVDLPVWIFAVTHVTIATDRK